MLVFHEFGEFFSLEVEFFEVQGLLLLQLE